MPALWLTVKNRSLWPSVSDSHCLIFSIPAPGNRISSNQTQFVDTLHTAEIIMLYIRTAILSSKHFPCICSVPFVTGLGGQQGRGRTSPLADGKRDGVHTGSRRRQVSGLLGERQASGGLPRRRATLAFFHGCDVMFLPENMLKISQSRATDLAQGRLSRSPVGCVWPRGCQSAGKVESFSLT